jgi:hypothetical protein
MTVAGFSKFSSPELFNPSLTTIRRPAFEPRKSSAELSILLKANDLKQILRKGFYQLNYFCENHLLINLQANILFAHISTGKKD